MKSIVNYPERGIGGSNLYRGNCSPKMIEDLINHFKPRLVFDPMVGSGTTKDVCNQLKVDCVVRDLNPKWGGWDALNDEVPTTSDLIFWHPPYHNMIVYSGPGNQWGTVPDERDLSRCKTYSEFIKKMNAVQAKLYTSLVKGGRLCILVGDMKKSGILYPIFRDIDWYGKLENVVIKAQNNCFSDKIQYSGKFIPIVHEYLLIFKREEAYLVPVRRTSEQEYDLQKSMKLSWRDVVLAALINLGGKATLKDLYQEISGHEKTKGNSHWQEKIRQVVQCYTNSFKSTARGEYSVAVA